MCRSGFSRTQIKTQTDYNIDNGGGGGSAKLFRLTFSLISRLASTLKSTKREREETPRPHFYFAVMTNPFRKSRTEEKERNRIRRWVFRIKKKTSLRRGATVSRRSTLLPREKIPANYSRMQLLFGGRSVRSLSRSYTLANADAPSHPSLFSPRRALEKVRTLPLAFPRAVSSRYYRIARATFAPGQRRRVVGQLSPTRQRRANRTPLFLFLCRGQSARSSAPRRFERAETSRPR